MTTVLLFYEKEKMTVIRSNNNNYYFIFLTLPVIVVFYFYELLLGVFRHGKKLKRSFVLFFIVCSLCIVIINLVTFFMTMTDDPARVVVVCK